MHVVLDEFNRNITASCLPVPAITPRLATAARTVRLAASADRRPRMARIRRHWRGGHGRRQIGCDHRHGLHFPRRRGAGKFWETLTSGVDPKTPPAEPRWSKIAGCRPIGDWQLVGGFITDFRIRLAQAQGAAQASWPKPIRCSSCFSKRPNRPWPTPATITNRSIASAAA